MRISKKAEYALRALTAMARHARSWSIQELSTQENIPVKFLEQILLSLRHAGILASKRGVGGGYTLLRAAQDITLGEVIRVLDGPLTPVPCVAARSAEQCTCPDRRTCPLRLIMAGLQHEMATLLESRSIEDMLRLSASSDALVFDI